MGFLSKIGKVFKKAVPAVLGGGLGFLTGGPAGAAIGAAGGLFGGKKFTEGEAPGAAVSDVRSPAERALGESQARYFSGLMEKPDLGFQEDEAALDPLYARATGRLKEQIAGSAAEKGFGVLQHGPSVSSFARGAQEMAENRLAGTVGRRDAYRRWVMSGGRAAATPTGRTSFATPGQESGLAALTGPALGSFMKGQGTDIGGRLSGAYSGFRNLFNRGGGGSYPTGSLFGGASYT